MIYNTAELLTNAVECFILIYFLIKIFGFKDSSIALNCIKTFVFGIALFSFVSFINQVFTVEGAYIIIDIVILFLYSRASLKGVWWKHLLISNVEIAFIFAINFAIVVINAIINGKDFLETFSLQNPLRIYFLIITKVMLFIVLSVFHKLIKKNNFELAKLQYLSAIIVMLISLIIGSSLATFLAYNNISSFYGSMVVVCLVIIDTLLLFIIFQFNSINQNKIKKELLETRINEYEKRIQDTIQWNNELTTLRHDLKNHFIVIADYIINDKKEMALKYIDETANKVENTKRYIQTNNMVLDAIINSKKAVCDQEKIDLKSYIYDDISGLDDRAFCIIFGNLLDNAIEAEVNETDKRIVISIKGDGDFVHLTIQNRIASSVLLANSNLVTTKDDAKSHGIGIKSVMATIKEMDGNINFVEKDNWFIVDVLIPYKIQGCIESEFTQ